MNQKTVKTAGQFSVIVLILGLLVMSPPFRFSLFVLAAFCAAIPSVFTSGKWRGAGIVIVIAALALAAVEYPAASSHMQHYRQRAKPKPAPTSCLPNRPDMISFEMAKNNTSV